MKNTKILREALETAYEVMERLGNILNNMDAVMPEEAKWCKPRFDKVRKALGREGMKLSDLEPRFASDNEGRRWITFDCPKCREHKIAVQIAGEGKFIWQISGTIIDGNISLFPSVAWAPKKPDGTITIVSECQFHFFVRNGAIEPLHA